MDTSILEKANGTYFTAPISRAESHLCYSNMRALFEYIDENNISRKAVYKLIQKKTNSLLGVTFFSKKLKTSNKEIKALLFPKKKRSKHPIMRIPYKSYHLMQAIIESVEEIRSTGQDFPIDLRRRVIDLTYGDAFMEKQISKYDDKFKDMEDEWRANESPNLYLHDDFHAIDSPFNRKIERR